MSLGFGVPRGGPYRDGPGAVAAGGVMPGEALAGDEPRLPTMVPPAREHREHWPGGTRGGGHGGAQTGEKPELGGSQSPGRGPGLCGVLVPGSLGAIPGLKGGSYLVAGVLERGARRSRCPEGCPGTAGGSWTRVSCPGNVPPRAKPCLRGCRSRPGLPRSGGGPVPCRVLSRGVPSGPGGAVTCWRWTGRWAGGSGPGPAPRPEGG